MLPALALLAVPTLLALPFLWPDGRAAAPATPTLGTTPRTVALAADPMAPTAPTAPTARPRPEYLTRSYRAPPALVRPGAGGTLRIPSLALQAPVDVVGLDGTAMAVPDDPGHLGWLSSTARSADLVGSSVVAGHVSDREDHPGALFRLNQIHPGAQIVWTNAEGRVLRFRVVRLRTYPRKQGLPAALFSTAGQHELHLVTCAERVTTTGGGFHYRSNLVVTAVPQ